MSRRFLIPVVAALALGACSYPEYATGRAPTYPSGYQPVMGGQAVFWPDQPGAQWGPEDVPSIDIFYEPLSEHGRWVDSRYGQVFLPNAPNGWRPYSNGQWQENRFWMSGDPWGWATDHYGRWGFDDQMGWMWVPGTQWGPSWVAWREADDVVGWAPIPPRVNWRVGVGFGSGWGYDNWNSWYGPSWVWVPRTSLFVSGFGGGILPWSVGLNWWGRSRWQHSPYWGWNQPWTPAWGWQAPAYAWNGWNRPGWSNWGWNRPGWSNRNYARGGYGRPGWNGGNWNNNRDWNREPRRGQPGSIGDRIGRDMTGRPPQNWNGGRPDRNGSNWNNNRDWNREPQGGQPGSVGDRIGRDMTGRPPQSWNGGRPDRNGDGRPDGWNGNRPGGNGQNDGRSRGSWNGNPGAGNPSMVPPNGGGWNGNRRGGNTQWGAGNQNRGQPGGGINGQRRPMTSDAAPASGNTPPRVSDAIGRGMSASVPQIDRAPPSQPAYRVSAPQPAYRAPTPPPPPPPREAPDVPVRAGSHTRETANPY
jgi:hypothetical protein